PDMMKSFKRKIAIESGIAAVSTLALGAAAFLLWLQPTMLGRNIALVAPVLAFALFIPAPRNMVEYHSELLYARGQTAARVGLLATIGALKAALMFMLIDPDIDAVKLISWMSVVFAVLYLVSASLTYWLIKKPARRI
ncbi:MAG: lipopolysaccharide biosynthesis protein, partial [Notoacmeibacter sp.]